jgi:hypothetical protein
MLGALHRPGEIQPDRRIRQQFPQQSGLAGLPRAKDEMYVRRRELLPPSRFDPTAKHKADLIIARLIYSQPLRGTDAGTD